MKTFAIIPTALGTALSAVLAISHARDYTLYGLHGHQQFGILKSQINLALLAALSGDTNTAITRAQVKEWVKRSDDISSQLKS